MQWHRGLRRLRLVGNLALGLGVLIIFLVWLTGALGYAPNAGFSPIFDLLARLGMALLILGGLLSVAAWIIQGFLPDLPQESHPIRARLDS